MIPGSSEKERLTDASLSQEVGGSSPSPGAIPAHYVIVRDNLPVGAAAAQIVHAAGESSPGNVGPDTFAVVLTAPDSAALEHVANQLRAMGLKPVLICEPDPPYNGAPTALGVYAPDRSVVRGMLRHLPLYGRQR